MPPVTGEQKEVRIFPRLTQVGEVLAQGHTDVSLTLTSGAAKTPRRMKGSLTTQRSWPLSLNDDPRILTLVPIGG